jgi:hypothetical protein
MSIKAPDRALSRQMRSLIDRAERDASRAFGSRVGVIMVFVPFDVDDSEMQYIANVKREDGVDMLRRAYVRGLRRKAEPDRVPGWPGDAREAVQDHAGKHRSSARRT